MQTLEQKQIVKQQIVRRQKDRKMPISLKDKQKQMLKDKQKKKQKDRKMLVLLKNKRSKKKLINKIDNENSKNEKLLDSEKSNKMLLTDNCMSSKRWMRLDK